MALADTQLTVLEDVMNSVYRPLPRYRDVVILRGLDGWYLQRGRLTYRINPHRAYDRGEFAREIDKGLNYVTEPEQEPIQVWLGLPCP